MNDIKVNDLAESKRAVPNPVTTFSQAFSNYRELNLFFVVYYVACNHNKYMYVCVFLYIYS